MRSATAPKLRVFFDSDVVIAGCASRMSSASSILLQLAELTLIEGIYTSYVETEVERNLKRKLPSVLPIFHTIIERALVEVTDPDLNEVESMRNRADQKDIPILAAAVKHNCQYLATFNVKDFWQPGDDIEVIEPGRLILKIRNHLAELRE